jgi:hypothetical protein
VSGPLTRVRDFYIAPGAASAPARVRVAPPPPAAAVLGRPRDAGAVGAALALALARTGGWPCALVALWRKGETHDLTLPAAPAARRLTARLNAHGLTAEATGRLARLTLADCPRSAGVELERATAATRAPVVVALAGPRNPDVDGVLRVQDVIVICCRTEDDPAVAEMAADSLSSLPAPVVVCRSDCSAAARTLALAGAAAPSSLRRALAGAVREVV